MSLKYEVLKRLVKAANIKKQWTGMSTQALLENRRRANAKNRIPDLKDDAFAISQIDVMGFPVLKLIHREKNDGHGDTPMPGYIMAISPGTCADTDAEWKRMLELEKKDMAIPAQYMKTAVEIMRHGDDSVPDYMLWLQRGDFTSCPKTTFIAFELAVLVGWISLIARGTFALIVAGIGFVLEFLIPWPFNGFASGFESFGWMLMFLGGRKLVARAIQEQSDTEREP